MLVTRDKLAAYGLADDVFFARRQGTGEPTSRDAFFLENPARLSAGVYCAIGNDEEGWQLEQFNGANWIEIEAQSNYTLIITSAGLAALTDIIRGGYRLTISGIKILDTLVTNPSTPVINWTDTEFKQAGGVVFTCGTSNSPHPADQLQNILKWKFLGATGGLQYIITLPADGLGSMTDDGEEDWDIGAIGLYVKSNEDGMSDILFAVGCLPNLIHKYSTTVERIGNSVKIYLNTVLNNLGIVSNLEVMQEDLCSIPEVPNETLLLYPDDPMKRPYNCYVVDSLYGSGIPALAVPRVLTSESQLKPDWAYFQPSDNYVNISPDTFDNVLNYQFVYWDSEAAKYKRAEGRVVGNTPGDNAKLPIGIRIGNSVVFAGTIINQAKNYTYSLSLVEGGADYYIGDELLAVSNAMTFKVTVAAINNENAITELNYDEATATGNIPLDPNPQVVSLVPDPRSSLKSGTGAKVQIQAIEQLNNVWNFPASWLNQPVYCDQGTNAGMPTLTKTDAFLGWVIGTNSIRLALDLRNEASETTYGTTRYATDGEVREVITNANSADQTAVTPKKLQANYLQITKPTNTAQAGSRINNPVTVNTFTKFNEVILGKGCDWNTPGASNPVVSFCGVAYQALWADLAEYYRADKVYEPGTLITFGQGDEEITVARHDCNGVISSKPGYQLGQKRSDLDLPVALCGRVPVLFDNECLPKTGDRIYLSATTPGRASTVANGKCLGKIIEKDFGTKKLLECVVRIEF